MNAVQLRAIFQQLAAKAPGSRDSVFRQRSVFNEVAFLNLEDDAKTELARLLVLESCPRPGAFMTNGDASLFLLNAAKEWRSWPQNNETAGRRLEHIAFAVEAAGQPLSFTSPLGVLASVYLYHQLEFVFRALSHCLSWEGKFLDGTRRDQVKTALKLKKSPPSRVNNIEMTYRIMLLNDCVPAVQAFTHLDAELPHAQPPKGKAIATIGERLAYFRHSVSHGSLPDPSSEGVFCALLMSIAVYGSALFPRSIIP